MKNNNLTTLQELKNHEEFKIKENFKFMVLIDNDVDLTKYFKSEKDAQLIENVSLKTRTSTVMGYKSFEVISTKSLSIYTMNYAFQNHGDTISVNLQILKNGKQWDMPNINANAIKFNR